MRRRNSRNVFDEDRETRKMLYISGSVLAIAILAFVITFIVYTNSFNNDEIQIGETKTSENVNSATASTQIGKSVNQVESQNSIVNTVTNTMENTQKVAINTTNMKKENITTNNNIVTSSNTTETNTNETNVVKTNSVANTVDSTTKDTTEKTSNTKKELKFVKPVEGEIVKEFAKEKLVYSETLREWVIHNGIDIKAEKTTIVKSAEDGTVKSIKNDPRYGITVVVEHQDGYKTIYSNLLTAEFIKEGEKVTQGQTLGTVGNTATFEIADDPHLHFEILKDDEYVNPEQYINN